MGGGGAYSLPSDKARGVVLLQREQLSSRHAHQSLELGALLQHSAQIHEQVSNFVQHVFGSDALIVSALRSLLDACPAQPQGALSASAADGTAISLVGRAIVQSARWFKLHGEALENVNVFDGLQQMQFSCIAQLMAVQAMLRERLASLVAQLDAAVYAKQKNDSSAAVKSSGAAWCECSDLHASMRAQKSKTQKTRTEELVLRNRVIRLEMDVHSHADLLQQWTAQLEELDARLPANLRNSDALLDRETAKVSGATCSPKSATNDDLAKTTGTEKSAAERRTEEDEEQKRALLLAALEDQIALAKRLPDQITQTRKDLESMLHELFEAVENAQKKLQTPIVEDGAALRSLLQVQMRKEIMQSSISQQLEGELQWLIIGKHCDEVEDKIFDSISSLIESSTDVYTKLFASFEKERVTTLGRMLLEATKTLASATSALEKIETQLSHKKNKEDERDQKQQELAKLFAQQKRALPTFKNALSELDALRSDVNREWDTKVERLSSDPTRADSVENLIRLNAENDGYWLELEGILQMAKEILIELDTEWEQLNTQYVEVRRAQKERLQLRQKVISIRESSKTVQARIRAEEQRIEALQQIHTVAQKLGSELMASARIAGELQKAVVSLLENQKRSEQSASKMYEKSNEQRAKTFDELRQLSESYNSSAGVTIPGELMAARMRFVKMAQQEFILEKELQRLKKAAKRKAAELHASSAEDMRDQYLRNLRKRRYCPIKPNFEKDTVLPRCGHAFSRAAIEDMQNKKCPTCGERFAADEPLAIFF